MDNTQKKLNTFISETQCLAEKALRMIDKNAWFKIIPSIDIGIPYDVDRLAGGQCRQLKPTLPHYTNRK